MSISSPQAAAPPEASHRIEADVAAPSQTSSALQMEALSTLAAPPSARGMNPSLAKTGKEGTADQIFHSVDKAEANLLSAKDTMSFNTETSMAKNEGSGASLALVVQDGKEYLDMNHEDPFSPNAKKSADLALGLV